MGGLWGCRRDAVERTMWKHTGGHHRESVSAEQPLCIHIAAKRNFFFFGHQASDTEARESSSSSYSIPLGEGIPLLGGLLSSTRKLLPFTGRLLVRTEPCSQPVSPLLWPSAVTPKVIEKSCPREATGTTRSPILSQHVDAMLQVYLVQRLY